MLRRRRASRVVDFQHRAHDYESCSAVYTAGAARAHEVEKCPQNKRFRAASVDRVPPQVFRARGPVVDPRTVAASSDPARIYNLGRPATGAASLGTPTGGAVVRTFRPFEKPQHASSPRI